MVVDIRARTGGERLEVLKYPQDPSDYLSQTRLRVLHVGKYYPPYRGGMESHLQVLSQDLRRIVDLKVMVANDARRTVREIIEGVDVTRVGRLFDFRAAPICPELVLKLRAAKADIIHIHWPNPTAVLAYLASGHSARLVFTYHSDIVRQKKLAVAFTPILRHVLSKAEAIVVSSPDYIEGSDILSEFRARCRVIPFGVSLDHFDDFDLKAVRRIRERYGPRIVLGVGRLVFYKGFEYLVRAMALVDAHLLLIGNGPLGSHLRQVASELGLKDRVTFLNEVDDVRPYYHAADVFALPSIMRSEAFGIVQLEAMACGKPVINTQLDSGVTFVSPHGVSGLTVPPAEPAALSHAINQLLDQPDRRSELGFGARQRVAHKFTVEKMIRGIYDLYHDVMSGQWMENVHS